MSTMQTNHPIWKSKLRWLNFVQFMFLADATTICNSACHSKPWESQQMIELADQNTHTCRYVIRKTCCVSWLKKSKMFFSNDAVQCFWAALLETSLVQLMNRILQNHFSRFGTLYAGHSGGQRCRMLFLDTSCTRLLHTAQTVAPHICRKLCSIFAQQILRHSHGRQLYGAFFYTAALLNHSCAIF